MAEVLEKEGLTEDDEHVVISPASEESPLGELALSIAELGGKGGRLWYVFQGDALMTAVYWLSSNDDYEADYDTFASSLTDILTDQYGKPDDKPDYEALAAFELAFEGIETTAEEIEAGGGVQKTWHTADGTVIVLVKVGNPIIRVIYFNLEKFR